jgi:hypothetical protein
MNIRRISLLFIVIILILPFSLTAKTKQSDESRFQLGFGVMVSTSNLLGLIQSVKMSSDIKDSGLTPEQISAFNSLPDSMKRSIYVSNILGSMEYGVVGRILWSALMLESDVLILPFDGAYNGRLDLVWTGNVGVRAPFWIMPYLSAGANFTFSWYPSSVASVDPWKSRWGSIGNFAWRPGINARAGLDFKFKHFSIGAYYQYTIKDFEEFTGWTTQLTENIRANTGVQDVGLQVAGMVIAAQSRFGVSLVWYFF